MSLFKRPVEALQQTSKGTPKGSGRSGRTWTVSVTEATDNLHRRPLNLGHPSDRIASLFTVCARSLAVSDSHYGCRAVASCSAAAPTFTVVGSARTWHFPRSDGTDIALVPCPAEAVPTLALRQSRWGLSHVHPAEAALTCSMANRPVPRRTTSARHSSGPLVT